MNAPCDLCGAYASEFLLEKAGFRYLRCQGCGFIYTDMRDYDPVQINTENLEIKKDDYLKTHANAAKLKPYVKVLKRLSRYRKTKKLLEIGCNLGGFLCAARGLGWDVSGIEPVPSYADYARSTYGLDVVTDTIEKAQLPQDTYDIVFSNSVFEHLYSPSRAMQNIAKTLRPGGVVYIKTLNYDSYTRDILGHDWHLLEPDGHFSIYTPATLCAFCVKAGLEILSVDSSGVRTDKRINSMFLASFSKMFKSAVAHWTLKGDRISVKARKPLKAV